MTDADGETLTVTLETQGEDGARLRRKIPLTVEQYAALTDPIEQKLDEADHAAEASPTRYTADEVFQRVKGRIHERDKV